MNASATDGYSARKPAESRLDPLKRVRQVGNLPHVNARRLPISEQNEILAAGPDLACRVENLGSVRRSRYFFWYFDAIAGAR